ncbi:immunoglobulin I-set domain protein, partial [Oesophagostomum dentatum]
LYFGSLLRDVVAAIDRRFIVEKIFFFPTFFAVSPKIVLTSPPRTSVPVGAPFSLKCGVRGYPEPKISWTVDGEPIAPGEGVDIGGDGTLNVAAASGRSATYKCTVKNDAGSDEIEYQVHTISAPVVSSEGLRTVNSTEGQPTSLPCDIVGDEPQIQWLKNDLPLLPTANIEFSEDKSRVNIHSTRLSDEGSYTCVAVNSAGKATQKTQLYNDLPLLPTANIEFSEDKSRVNIHSTRLSDEGSYTCVAVNSAGKATQKTQLYVGGGF